LSSSIQQAALDRPAACSKWSSRGALLTLLRDVRTGVHTESPLLMQYRCREFAIEAVHTTVFNVDGELIQADCVNGTVQAGALQLIA